MRTRDNIEEASVGIPDDNLYQHLSLEVLLDIRELLDPNSLHVHKKEGEILAKRLFVALTEQRAVDTAALGYNYTAPFTLQECRDLLQKEDTN